MPIFLRFWPRINYTDERTTALGPASMNYFIEHKGIYILQGRTQDFLKGPRRKFYYIVGQ